jgi:hypothetical protein
MFVSVRAERAIQGSLAADDHGQPALDAMVHEQRGGLEARLGRKVVKYDGTDGRQRVAAM